MNICCYYLSACDVNIQYTVYSKKQANSRSGAIDPIVHVTVCVSIYNTVLGWLKRSSQTMLDIGEIGQMTTAQENALN